MTWRRTPAEGVRRRTGGGERRAPVAARTSAGAALAVAAVLALAGCTREPEAAAAAVPRLHSLLPEIDAAERSSPGIVVRAVEVGGEERAAIFAHAPSTVTFRGIPLGETPALRFGVGIQAGAMPSDGVDFSVQVTAGGETATVWRHEVVPAIGPEGWQDVRVPLDGFAGEVVDVAFLTRIRGDHTADYSAWGAPAVEGVATEATLAAAAPVRREVLVARLDPAAPRRLTVEAGDVLELSGEVSRLPAGHMPPAPEVVFRISADGEPLFERQLRPILSVNSFGASVPLTPWAGRDVELRFELELPEEIPGLSARWLQAVQLRPATAPRQAAGAGPNLLFVVVDTLRSDHVGAYGAQRPTTPNLDRLAAQGVLFEQAISQASWTMPATASLLTGLYPTEHRVAEGRPLAREVETVAERAQDLGMTTLGISANPIVGRAEGFVQGHERFVHLPWARAAGVNELLLQLLSEAAGSRWYAYVHYIDPHDPYDAPAPYGSMFLDGYRSPFADKPTFKSLVDAVNFGQGRVEYEERDLDYLRAAYDGEIRYWDDRFGRLLATLEERGLLRDTIVVVTSDHGEEFLDHGRLKHGPHLYEESIHVPLLVHAPETFAPARFAEPFETRRVADLVTRLLRGGEQPAEDLLRGLRAQRGVTFSHSTHGLLEPGKGRTPLMAVRDPRWKLIHYPQAGRRELYDLAADPGERSELAAQRPEIAERHLELLRRWLDATSERALPVAGPDNERILEELRALGYIQ